MLGGFFSVLSAVMFAYANASVRRGVLTGTVLQAVVVSLPVALPIFALAMLMCGGFSALANFSWRSIWLFSIAGVVHLALARYCNYRATKAIGANLVAPIQQYSLIITLVLAVLWLGESLTALRILGIVLVLAGPMLTLRPEKTAPPVTDDLKSDAIVPFSPNLAEGYLYSLLSAVGFGISPIFIAMAFSEKSIATGIAGVFVSYIAATIFVCVPLLALPKSQAFKSADRQSTLWFVISGIAVGLSQMTRYMALAVAPVSVVMPIQRLSLVFRLYFGSRINPHHEIFDESVVWGTVIALAGAVALSVSSENVLAVMPQTPFVQDILIWHWP